MKESKQPLETILSSLSFHALSMSEDLQVMRCFWCMVARTSPGRAVASQIYQRQYRRLYWPIAASVTLESALVAAAKWAMTVSPAPDTSNTVCRAL